LVLRFSLFQSLPCQWPPFVKLFPPRPLLFSLSLGFPPTSQSCLDSESLLFHPPFLPLPRSFFFPSTRFCQFTPSYHVPFVVIRLQSSPLFLCFCCCLDNPFGSSRCFPLLFSSTLPYFVTGVTTLLFPRFYPAFFRSPKLSFDVPKFPTFE